MDELRKAVEAATKVVYGRYTDYTADDVRLAKQYGLIEREVEADNDRSRWMPTAKLDGLQRNSTK